MPKAARPRWWRLSLRGLMVLVLLAGGSLGWIAYRVRAVQQAVAAVRMAGGDLIWKGDDDSPRSPPGWQERAWQAGVAWLGADPWFDPTYAGWSGPPPPDILDHIGRFRGLRSLSIGNATSIQAGWEQLGQLTDLRFLSLDGPGVGDDALRIVARLPRLEHLELNGIDATAAGFAALGASASLEVLSVTDCPVLSDPRAARLWAGLPRLKSLVLNLAPSDPVGGQLVALGASDHPDLTHLYVYRATLPPHDLAAMARLRNLEYLDLTGSILAAHDLAPLRDLTRLRTLILSGTNTTDAALATLAGSRINSLDLDLTSITDAGMDYLARLPDLTELDLSDCPRLTDAGLRALRNVPNLRHVDLGGPDRLADCPGLTAQGLADLRAVVADVRTTFLDDPPPPIIPPSASP